MVMYTRDDAAIIQGKMPSRRNGSKRYSTTWKSQSNSYQYDTKNMHDEHPANMAPKGFHKQNMHDDNKSIPTTYNKGSQSIT